MHQIFFQKVFEKSHSKIQVGYSAVQRKFDRNNDFLRQNGFYEENKKQKYIVKVDVLAKEDLYRIDLDKTNFVQEELKYVHLSNMVGKQEFIG